MKLTDILTKKQIETITTIKESGIINKINAKKLQLIKNKITIQQGQKTTDQFCFCGGYKEQENYINNFYNTFIKTFDETNEQTDEPII